MQPIGEPCFGRALADELRRHHAEISNWGYAPAVLYCVLSHLSPLANPLLETSTRLDSARYPAQPRHGHAVARAVDSGALHHRIICAAVLPRM
jgi:hypothetical protein